ncbi:hypothetical protein NKDENANG_00904 [Candidatus Entotheonellaceae bacterium PAL068K]
MPYAWVAGVDGCRAGWIVALVGQPAPQLRALQVQVCTRFDAVLSLVPAPLVIAIDIPIGLLDEPLLGGRTCDRQARRLLGRRASSVFSPPCRRILQATQYEQVRRHGMNRQAFGILPKVREVDRLMTPALQHRVYEAHPELAFTSLVGHPMQHSKKTSAGREERLRALAVAFTVPLRRVGSSLAQFLKNLNLKRTEVAPDDLLDACVLTWTVCRIVQGSAGRVPITPPVDARGLRMEIEY